MNTRLCSSRPESRFRKSLLPSNSTILLAILLDCFFTSFASLSQSKLNFILCSLNFYFGRMRYMDNKFPDDWFDHSDQITQDGPRCLVSFRLMFGVVYYYYCTLTVVVLSSLTRRSRRWWRVDDGNCAGFENTGRRRWTNQGIPGYRQSISSKIRAACSRRDPSQSILTVE